MRINIRETNGNGDTIPVFESVTCCFNGIYELIALPFNRETEKYIRLDTARNLGTWTFRVVPLPLWIKSLIYILHFSFKPEIIFSPFALYIYTHHFIFQFSFVNSSLNCRNSRIFFSLIWRIIFLIFSGI